MLIEEPRPRRRGAYVRGLALALAIFMLLFAPITIRRSIYFFYIYFNREPRQDRSKNVVVVSRCRFSAARFALMRECKHRLLQTHYRPDLIGRYLCSDISVLYLLAFLLPVFLCLSLWNIFINYYLYYGMGVVKCVPLLRKSYPQGCG